MHALYEQVAAALLRSRLTVVLTGAGVSAASGVPTFRGEDGLWRNYRAEDLATPAAFERDPQLVWSWYQWRLELVLRNAPNAAHVSLARLGERFGSLWIVTQNVDGYHRQAGSPQVIELHGSLRCCRCQRCEKRCETPVTADLPACECGGRLRPDVVWFGEALPLAALEQAWELAADCDLLISAGTSGLVVPAASLPAVAARAGALTVEINPAVTTLSSLVDIVIPAAADTALPEIWSLCEKEN